jgi:hypothetical protein
MPSLDRRIVDENLQANMSSDDLLLWSMNQLFRSARTIDLLQASKGLKERDVQGRGADITARVILKTFIKTKRGWDLVKKSNPRLLKGFRKPSL